MIYEFADPAADSNSPEFADRRRNIAPVCREERHVRRRASNCRSEAGKLGVPAEGNSPYAMGDRKGENRDSPPSFRAIGSADAQDINRKPWTLYSAGMAVRKSYNVGTLQLTTDRHLLILIVLHNVGNIFIRDNQHHSRGIAIH